MSQLNSIQNFTLLFPKTQISFNSQPSSVLPMYLFPFRYDLNAVYMSYSQRNDKYSAHVIKLKLASTELDKHLGLVDVPRVTIQYMKVVSLSVLHTGHLYLPADTC